ncbi:CotH kinase family protein [Algoriphagus boseongensis]|nr:CotH kinase family protein [Algoriphagus boseongensis]
MTRRFFLFLMIIFAWVSFDSKGFQTDEGPNFSNHSGKIQNQVNLELDSKELKNLKAVTGRKTNLNANRVLINEEEVTAVDIHTRGQTTLNFPRKSLSLDLEKSLEFGQGSRKVKMKHLILLSLAMDKYYVRNRLAFGMLQELGMLDFFYSYANLSVNQASQGIYFLVERPQDWAIQEIKSPIVIRRGYGHSIAKSKTEKNLSKEDTKKYVEAFKQIYHSSAMLSGESLYQPLSKIIDLENYMTWMAVNFLVRNGDYADEVFFYIDPKTGLFKVIPWDYDDIFSAIPHEGKMMQSVSSSKYIFSKEDDLDKKIADDPYLYSKYLEILKDVSARLSDSVLKEIFESTYAELYPYYSDPEILENVKFDLYPDASLDKLKQELASDFLLIQGARRLISLELGQN